MDPLDLQDLTNEDNAFFCCRYVFFLSHYVHKMTIVYMVYIFCFVIFGRVGLEHFEIQENIQRTQTMYHFLNNIFLEIFQNEKLIKHTFLNPSKMNYPFTVPLLTT